MTILEALSWFSVFATAALSAMVLVRRPPAPLWPSLFFVGAGTFVWCLGESVDSFVVESDEWYQRWLVVEYTGVLWTPPVWWYFGSKFAELHGVQLPKAMPALRRVPLFMAGCFWLAMITNPWHGQFFTPVFGGRSEFHAIWYVQATINYVLMAGVIGLFLWLRRHSTDRNVREQLTIMLAASVVPLIANFLWVTQLVESGRGGVTSSGLGVSMVLFFTGIYRDRLFTLSSISMHHLIEHEPDGMLVMDRLGRLLHSNPAADKLLDRVVLGPGSDVFALLARVLRFPDDSENASALDIEAALTSSPYADAPVVFRLEHEPPRWLELYVVPIPDRSGRRLGTGLRLRDVTTLREVREQLREQAAVLEAILGSTEQGMLVVDSSGEAVYSNRAFRDLWSPDGGTAEAGGTAETESDTARLAQAIEAMPAADADAFRAELAADGDVEAVSSSRREMVLGDGRIIESAFRPLLEDGVVSGRVFSFFDVTATREAESERQQLERQVQQAQKMESLGVLAGGIAHDFNNLLVGILGNADLALGGAPPNSPLHDSLEDIVDSSRRAAELTNQMLAYSGRSQFVIEIIDVPRLTNETRHLVDAVISKAARVELDLQPVPPVQGDPAQLRQVIMNLITNASDALRGLPGTVSVATQGVDVTRDELSGYQLGDSIEPGRFVAVDVTDTGAGMNEEVASRIFDPFFTTKFTGRGLGLSAVLGIVRAHRGAIRVDSKPGEGTTIRLLLPTTELPLTEADRRADVAAASEDWRGRGTILVADDEPHVLRVLARTLERAGFSVVTAVNGRDALERWAEANGDFVAVLLDMTMPEMGGRETLGALRRLGATVPVVLSSGYSADETNAQFEGDGPDAFIQKPYEASTLISTLRNVIEQG